MTWTTTQLAKMLGITPQSVNEAVRAGYIPKKARGQFDPVEAVSGYIKRLKERATGTSDNLAAARTQLAKADLELREIEISKQRNRLADVGDLMAANNEIFELIVQTIKTSDLADDRKEDILGAICDHFRRWGERYG